MRMIGQDSLKTRRTLTVDGKTYHYFSLPEAAKSIGDVSRLPFSLKVLLENVLRYEDGRSYTVDDAKAIAEWAKTGRSDKEVPFRPARILMQDFTGVPAVVDLAAMRDGIVKLGGEPRRVNPLVPVRLRQFPRGPARHRHLPPGEPRIPGAGGLDRGRWRRCLCLPRQLLRH